MNNYKNENFNFLNSYDDKGSSILDQLSEENIGSNISTPNPGEGLSPLTEVFLPDEIMNGVLEDIGIAYAMSGSTCARPGIVLSGPPGTGKSVLGKAIVQSYANFGAYSNELSITSMQSMWMG